MNDALEDARNHEIDLIKQRDEWEFALRKQIVATAPDCLDTLDQRRAMGVLSDVVRAGFDAKIRAVQDEIDALDAMDAPHIPHSERYAPAGSVSH